MQYDNLPDDGDGFEEVDAADDFEYKPSGNEWGRGHYISDNENKNIKKSERIAMRVFVVAWIALTAVLLLLGLFVEDFPFIAWVYSLFGGAMLFAVLILMIKVTANSRYRRGNDKNYKKSPLKIALSVLLMLAFGACGICGFIFNIFWLIMVGFAGLIVTFFIVYGVGF